MSIEYGYQPTDLEDELFLSNVPLDVITNSIESQFKAPLEYRKKDYIQSFITKYFFSKENMMEDDQYIIDQYHDKFITFIEEIFEEYLNVGFTNVGDMEEESQLELIHLTYRFFIKNIKKNFVNIINNYIDSHTEEINENFDKKKDVTTLNFKTEIDDEFDIFILSNLSKIIDYILSEISLKNDVDMFFDLCIGDEPILELDFVKNAYEEMELTGNFIQKYIDMIDNDFKIEIQTKIRNRILKKYPNRSKNEVIEEPTEVDENKENEESDV